MVFSGLQPAIQKLKRFSAVDFVRAVEDGILGAFADAELLVGRFDWLKRALRILPISHAILPPLLDEHRARTNQ
jgi:hypothetical protein